MCRYLSLHWHVCSTCRREDTHELLKRVEGLRVSLKFGGNVIQVDEVGGERCVVVRKVPLPGCASLNENSNKICSLLNLPFQTWLHLVVVSQHPAQAYCVLVGNPVPEFSLGGQNAELGLIISVLETILIESHLERKSTNLS